MLTIGSLFAGIGGLELGLELAGLGPTLWQVEPDSHCRSVLAKHWPDADRRVDDVRGATTGTLRPVDLICGGFPCQDISLAGGGAGLGGTRSGLWFEFARVVRELLPRCVVVENVAALRGRGLHVVLGDLAACGYDALWFPVRAADVGAPHRRERLFVVAWRTMADARGGERRAADLQDAAQRDRRARSRAAPSRGSSENDSREHVADRDHERREAQPASRLHGSGQHRNDVARRCVDAFRGWPPGPEDREGWARWLADGGPQPAIRRGADGLSARLDERLRSLGNAVVPQVGLAVGLVVRGLITRGVITP